MAVTFYGSSDDLIEVAGISGAAEFYAGSPDKDIAASFEVKAPNGDGLRVHAIYDDKGVWSFAVAQLDDSVELPSWPVEIQAWSRHSLNDYSTMLVIGCPDDAVLRRLSP